MKCIPIEEYNLLLAQIAENNKPENKVRILAERNEPPAKIKSALKYPESELSKKMRSNFENALLGVDKLRANILEQIAEIRKEKLPPHRTSFYGKKSWQAEQDDKVKELEKQLDEIK